jgi:Asp-tRNA(Asn)/Glu-tRNA(Gln) amidotransferase A subunit family amidase
MVPVALGTQTVGSVLRPAAFCGVVGLKPTYGRISRRGVIPAAWTLDHVGVLARSVADSALVLGVLAGPDPADPGSLAAPPPAVDAVVGGVPERAPRLGLVGAPLTERATPDMRAHLEAVTATLAARGAVVEEVELPALVPALLSAVQVVLRAETAAYHAECFRRHAAEYRPRIRAAIELGFLIPAPLYLKAQQIRREVRRHMAPLFTQVDALLMPPAPGSAPDPSTTGDPVFNALASGVGLPAISIPTGLAPDGLPLGIQLVGAPLAEPSLLEAARWVEAVVGPGVAPPEP